MAVSFKNLGLAEPSTVTARVATVQIARGSTNEQQEILVLGDPESSLGMARVLAAVPASTEYGLVVREADPSTGPFAISSVSGVVTVSTGPFAISSIAGPVTVRSSAANALVSVYQSTAADLNVTVAGYSTTVNVSSLAGAVQARIHDSSGVAVNASTAAPAAGDNGLIVRQVGFVAPSTTVAVSTGSVRVHQSTAGDLNVTVAGYSTTVNVSSLGGVVIARLQDSSAVGINGSTGPVPIGVNALHVREGLPALLSTTTLITSTHSTAVYALISSAAGLRQKVYAYFVGSTHTNPSTLVFMSSLAIDRWHVAFGSGSSGMTGANLACSPPAWLFHADAANALNVRIEGGSSVTSTVVARISFSYFSEA